jgi:hypothetical protein
MLSARSLRMDIQNDMSDTGGTPPPRRDAALLYQDTSAWNGHEAVVRVTLCTQPVSILSARSPLKIPWQQLINPVDLMIGFVNPPRQRFVCQTCIYANDWLPTFL